MLQSFLQGPRQLKGADLRRLFPSIPPRFDAIQQGRLFDTDREEVSYNLVVMPQFSILSVLRIAKIRSRGSKHCLADKAIKPWSRRLELTS